MPLFGARMTCLVRRAVALLFLAIAICFVVVSPTFAIDTNIWTLTTGSGTWSSLGVWSNNFAPPQPGTFNSTALITNVLTGTRVSAVDLNYNIHDLVASNANAAGTGNLIVRIQNGNVLRVDGTTVIGTNTILDLGSNTTGGSIFSNNNLFLVDNAIIRINSGGTGNAATLTVGGTFTNTTQSTISNSGSEGAVTVKFLANSTITNSGTMLFLAGRGSSGDQMLMMTIGTTSNNFLVNAGTLILGFDSAGTGPRKFAISNQFLNTGTFVITNNPTTSTAGSKPDVVFTGSTRTTGGASTNTGTMLFAVDDGAGNNQGAGSLTFLNGDFVNSGNITTRMVQVGDVTSFTLSEANAVFSNASGGRIILASGGTGTFALSAAKIVNAAGATMTAAGGTLSLNQLPVQDGNIVISSGGTLALTPSSGAFVNGGTILLNGGLLMFTGNFTGSYTNSGTLAGFGTNSLDTVFNAGTGRNPNMINKGTIIASNGLLMINVADSFTQAGFSNASGASIIISNASTFGVNRTQNAWQFDANHPANEGTITLNGGTLTLFWNGTQGPGDGTTNYHNDATIIGSGTIAASIRQTGNGSTIASNGVLNVFANGATFTSSGGQFGTMKAVSGGDLKVVGNIASGNGASWVVNAGGTLEISGVNADLGTAFMPASQLNGTVLITSGGNLTLSASTGSSGQTVAQNGTFEFAGGASGAKIFMPNTGGLSAFTNVSSGIMSNSSGRGTFTTGFGSGQNNYGFVNNGTIVVSGTSFTVDPGDAANSSGFSNSLAGVIVVNANGAFIIKRTSGSWGSNGDTPNVGYIILNGGTVTTMDDGGTNVTRTIRNSGTIVGSGTMAFGVFNPNNNGQVIASNGVLVVGQVFGGGGANGTWIAKNGGTLLISSNTDLSGAVIQITGNTLQVGQGGTALNNTLTLSTAFLNNDGTIVFGRTSAANGSTVTMANTAGLNAFTNSGYIIAGLTGRGTFVTGFGAGQNYAFVNAGTLIAGGGGTLVISPNDANIAGGFSNTANGFIFITNGSSFAVQRSANAWANNTVSANAGTIVMSNGTFVAIDLGGSGSASTRFLINSGTINSQGIATNFWNANFENRGSLLITNNGTTFQILGNKAMTNTSSGQIILGTNGASATLIATNIGDNGNALVNQGLIQGQGTITLGITNDARSSGSSGNFINSGNLIATNFGGAAAGTMFISVGNAFSNGGFSNTAAGTIFIASNMTLTVNRTQNAWANSGNSVANLGTISLVGGSLNLASDGLVSNAASFINSGTISGWGTIDSVVITTNGGKVFANATNLVSGVGTLTLRVASTTNNSTATLGTIGTNSVLNLIAPGGQNVLINFGTISLSGGSINFSGGTGTITNFFVVAGVGNLSSFGVVNTGATASVVAQAPIPGLSNLLATVNVTNSAILAANNLFGGAATLTLGTSTGGGLVNNGTLAIQGGFITVTNAAGADAGVTNNTGQIYGFGAQRFGVANLSGGSIVASNGVFSLGLLSNLNLGLLSNFNSSATVQLTNSIVVNQGRIALNGGGLVLSSGPITNQATITGPGAVSSTLYNDTAGFLAATNGVLNIATNAGESVVNLGTFDISSGSTLSNGVSAWNNSNGIVRINAGTLTGGSVTNKGTILGNGTLNSMVGVVNAAAGIIKASNGVLNIVAPNSTVVQQGTMIGGTASGTYISLTNNTGGQVVNNGTMLLDGSGNLAFYILNNFTNASTATIRGAGVLQSGDGVLGGANWNVFNAGLIQATNGTLMVNLGDAFLAGFNNLSAATVTVANASAFAIARTANAWTGSGTNPVNNGAILLNGGSIATFDVTGTGPGAATSANATRTISNAVSGLISGSGTIGNNLANLGTVNATNGTLVLAGTAQFNQNGTLAIQNGATFTMLQNTGSFANRNQFLLFGGTFVGTNFTQLVNTSAGVISGFGTINTGTPTSGAANGANQEIINSGGQIIATNGTLFVNPGDAFNAGGFTNSALGRITVASGAAFVLNRTANAWDNVGNGTTNPRNLGTISLLGGSWSNFSNGASSPGRFIDNFGTIVGQGTFSGSITNFGTIGATNGTLAITGTGRFSQTGTLAVDTSGTLLLSNVNGLVAFTNGGSILMRGGTLTAGVVANTNVIFGFGTISGGGVDNSGALLASNGTLVASLSSFTNGTSATLGTLSTNATLDVSFLGGATQPLINRGTMSFAGGTLLFSGTGGGTITNTTIGLIVGVGDITANTVINNGTILAANPVSGLNIFSVGLSDLNGSTATLGASNGAILNVTISGGAGSSFNNNGSISMLGGLLIISNATPGTITNLSSAFVSGVGTVQPNIVNSGTVQATVSGGILDVSLSATNSGFLRAGSGATLTIENSSFVNAGTIGAVGAAGGTIQTAGVITNRNLITGFGGLAVNGFVQNDSVGRITATNGVLSFGAIDGLANQGTIDVQNSGTFQSNSSNSWANAGTIDMRGGTLRTGGFTNAAVSAVFTNNGFVDGYGTIIGGGAFGSTGAGFDKSIVNLGTIIATNPISGSAQTLVIDTGGATTQDGIRNLGTMIVSSNNTLALNRQAGLPILNTGTITINNGTLTGSGVLSNTAGGIIEGYGTLTHQIVNLALGTIRATNGNMVLTSTVNPVNFGTFQIANAATMTWNASNSWINLGTIDMRGGTLRTGGTTNTPPPAGPFPGEPFTNGNYIVGSGTIIGGGAFGGSGSGFDKSIVNTGVVVASGGTLTLNTGVATANRGLANLGTMIVATSNDTLQLLRTAEFSPTVTNLNYIYNSGTILLNGGTLTSNTSITNNNESVSLPGLVQGYGTINLTNELVNLGTIRSSNTVAGGDGILRFVSGATPLRITQNGTLAVEGGSQMIFGSNSNAPIVNSGTILMDGGFLRSGLMTNRNLAQITGFGTITSSIFNSGTLVADGSPSNLHLTGSTVFNETNGFFGANNGRVIVDTVFTNLGAVTFINGVGTFNGDVFNGGTWTNDPTTNFFAGNLTVAGTRTLITSVDIITSNLNVTATGNYSLTQTSSVFVGINTTNAGILRLRQSSAGVFSNIFQNSGSYLSDHSSSEFRGLVNVTSAGRMTFSNASVATFSSFVTNAGTVSFLSSVGTFTTDVMVTNGGAWVMDASTYIFGGQFVIASNAYIAVASPSVSRLSNNFVNVSRRTNDFNTLNATFIMDGAGTQQFYVAGLNLGGYASSAQPSNEVFFTNANGTFSTNSFSFGIDDTIYGYSNNFALGTLQLSMSSTTVLMDAFGTVGPNDSNVAGLYLDTLTLNANSLLIISNNVELYFKSTNGVTGVSLGVLNPGDNVLLLDGSSFHQLGVVPEPSILMLLILGGGVITWHRRRRRRGV